MIVNLARDVAPFVMYCVYGESRVLTLQYNSLESRDAVYIL